LALDYVSAYIGLEMQSFVAYIITALSGASEAEATSGLLYFFVGSLGSVVALLGLSISYLQTASLTWGLWPFSSTPSPLVTAGLLMKIGSGPFSFWVPIVYSAVPLITLAWLTSSPLIGLITKL
jgi:NADH-quinone oxidoreductase subunit N